MKHIYVRKVTENIRRKKNIGIDVNSSVPIDWSSPDLCKYGHLPLVHNKPDPKSVSSALIWITLEGPQIGYELYLIGIASPNMFGWYSYMCLNFEGLELCIKLYYVFERGWDHAAILFDRHCQNCWGAEGVKSMKAEPSWIWICHWSPPELYISSLIAGCPEIVGLSFQRLSLEQL